MPRIKSQSWWLAAKGKRPNRAWVHLPIYDHGVYVLWPVDAKQLKAEYLHACKLKEAPWPEEGWNISGGKFLSYQGHDCIAFRHEKPAVNLIAHEVYHYARSLKQELDLSGEEANAYLIGFVTEQIYNLTRGKECKV